MLIEKQITLIDTMGEVLQNLECVYAKWENKSSGPRSQRPDNDSTANKASVNYDRLMSQGRQAWRDKFSDYKRPQRRQVRSRHVGRSALEVGVKPRKIFWTVIFILGMNDWKQQLECDCVSYFHF